MAGPAAVAVQLARKARTADWCGLLRWLTAKPEQLPSGTATLEGYQEKTGEEIGVYSLANLRLQRKSTLQPQPERPLPPVRHRLLQRKAAQQTTIRFARSRRLLEPDNLESRSTASGTLQPRRGKKIRTPLDRWNHATHCDTQILGNLETL